MTILQKIVDGAGKSAPKTAFKELAKLLRGDQIVLDETGRRAFETDAFSSHKAIPLIVLMPETTEEVAGIVMLLNKYDVPIVPRGAGTSLSGGAIPTEESAVLCLSRMNNILDVDVFNRTARLEAGVTNLAVSEAVKQHGLFYAPDPSSQLACTIGGNIAMNSGGAHCLKYGVTTHNLLGVKMVLMNGEIVDIGGPYFDPAGYDFLSLIAGSEGGLGIVTEAVVQLKILPEGALPMLLGFKTHKEAGDCVAAIIGSGVLPVAIEFMDKPAIKACEEFAKAGYPLDVEALLIIEVEGSPREIENGLQGIMRIASGFNPIHKRIAETQEEASTIWRGRKAAFGAVGRINDYLCMDGVIPLSNLSEVLEKVTEICKSHHFKVANIFHAGDGNLHPLILYDANKAGEIERVEKCGGEILDLCVRAGGCLTGEHGVGLEKRDLMTLQFSKVDLDNQMRIKQLFDPDWRLNPDKVFPLEIRDEFLSASEADASEDKN